MRIEVEPTSVLAAAADVRLVQHTVEQLGGAFRPLREDLGDWAPDVVLQEALRDLHDTVRFAVGEAVGFAERMHGQMVAAVEVYAVADDLMSARRG